MGIRNLNWYNLQATRRYPLDDLCSGETDSGQSLPNDILVDLHLRFDNSLGTYVYVQAATVSDYLVTVVLGVSDSLNAAGKSIAAVTISKPTDININYAVTPLIDGVAGWVVFGAGIDAPPFSGRFSAPIQSLIASRCARPYSPLPITSMSKLNVAAKLSGIVNLAEESPIKIEYKKVTIDADEKQLIVFSLNQADSSLAYNPLSYFLGACSQRPESNTCGKTPISSINGVSPDCYGNIDIVFDNLTAEAFTDCGGVDIVTDYSVKQACQGPPSLPLFYSDLCCPRRFDTIADRDLASGDEFNINDIVRVGVSAGASATTYEYYRVESLSGGVVTWSASPIPSTDPDLKAALAQCDWPDPADQLPDVVINLQALQDYPAVTLPACIDFCSCDPTPPMFEVVQGVFSGAKTMAPFGCVACNSDEAAPTSQEEILALKLRNTYVAVDNGNVALSLFKNTASDWAFGRAITAQVKIGTTGLARNGGVVINYRKAVVAGVQQIKYSAAVIDVGRGEFRLLEYVNNSSVVVASVPVRIFTENWYKISVYPALLGDYIYLNAVVEEMKPNGVRAEIVDYRIPLADYEPQTGAFGLFAASSYTYFNAFTIT
jgi:hypothetical protein